MAGFLGNQPSQVPLTSADIVDGTITNDDLAGSITDAKISALSASKLTGSLPASMATDLAPVRSDILKLALHQAIDGNRVAYNLEDSFVDGFEDDTGITTETTVDRDATGEYVNSTTLGTPAYDSGDRTATITVTDSGVLNDGPNSDLVNATTTAGAGSLTFYSQTVTSASYIRFQFASSKLITEATLLSIPGSAQGLWKWQGSDNASTWTDIGGSFTLSGTGTNVMTTLSGNTTSYTYYQIAGISGSTTGSDWHTQITFKITPQTLSATGTLISDPQTASTSRTSASGVIIYEDGAGTNTLGTDLKIYFSCDNSTWTEAASYGTATTYSGTKKLVKLGATTCTAGTSIAMKAVWANQSASKEARLHGWAVNY